MGFVDFNKIKEMRKEDETKLYLVLSGDKSFGPNSSMIMKTKDGQDIMASGYDIYQALVDRLIRKKVSEGFTIDIRHGDNEGVDQLAMMYGKAHGYVLRQHKAAWDKIGSSAAYRRNEDMFLMAGLRAHKGTLLLWDGKDPYTRHMMFCAWANGVPCKVWNYVTKSWVSQEEIERVQMEVRQEQISYGRVF